MRTLRPSRAPGFPPTGIIYKIKASSFSHCKKKKICLSPLGFAICLTQQVATCGTSRGKMVSEASGPLVSEEGEFLVSKESITNIPGICRPLCIYYFFTLKWFEGEGLERKMRLPENACGMVVLCVHTQT